MSTPAVSVSGTSTSTPGRQTTSSTTTTTRSSTSSLTSTSTSTSTTTTTTTTTSTSTTSHSTTTFTTTTTSRSPSANPSQTAPPSSGSTSSSHLPISTPVIGVLSALAFILLVIVAYRAYRFFTRRSRSTPPPPPPPDYVPPYTAYPHSLHPPSQLFANPHERKSYYESGSFASLVAGAGAAGGLGPGMARRYSATGSWSSGQRGSGKRGSWTPTAVSGEGSVSELELGDQPPQIPTPPPPGHLQAVGGEKTDYEPDSAPNSPDPLLGGGDQQRGLTAALAAAAVITDGSEKEKPNALLTSRPSRTSIHSSDTSASASGSGSGSGPSQTAHARPPRSQPASASASQQGHGYSPSLASSHHTRASVHTSHTRASMHSNALYPPPLPPGGWRGAPHAPHMRGRVELVFPEPLAPGLFPQREADRNGMGQGRVSTYGGSGYGVATAVGLGVPGEWGEQRGRSVYGPPGAGGMGWEENVRRYRASTLPHSYQQGSPRSSPRMTPVHSPTSASHTSHSSSTPGQGSARATPVRQTPSGDRLESVPQSPASEEYAVGLPGMPSGFVVDEPEPLDPSSPDLPRYSTPVYVDPSASRQGQPQARRQSTAQSTASSRESKKIRKPRPPREGDERGMMMTPVTASPPTPISAEVQGAAAS